MRNWKGCRLTCRYLSKNKASVRYEECRLSSRRVYLIAIVTAKEIAGGISAVSCGFTLGTVRGPCLFGVLGISQFSLIFSRGKVCCCFFSVISYLKVVCVLLFTEVPFNKALFFPVIYLLTDRKWIFITELI